MKMSLSNRKRNPTPFCRFSTASCLHGLSLVCEDAIHQLSYYFYWNWILRFRKAQLKCKEYYGEFMVKGIAKDSEILSINFPQLAFKQKSSGKMGVLHHLVLYIVKRGWLNCRHQITSRGITSPGPYVCICILLQAPCGCTATTKMSVSMKIKTVVTIVTKSATSEYNFWIPPSEL